jgi:glutathione peroxidase
MLCLWRGSERGAGGATRLHLKTVYDYSAAALTGETIALSAYRGVVLLIVNTASECGFTPQYQGLQALHRKFAPDGFSVLGFPCNQFGAQEPGDERKIAKFCSETYGISFPMFAKVDVNGVRAHPLFEHLKRAQPGILGTLAIKWNFTKFLIDQKGNVKVRFAPSTKPVDLEPAIAALIKN